MARASKRTTALLTAVAVIFIVVIIILCIIPSPCRPGDACYQVADASGRHSHTPAPVVTDATSSTTSSNTPTSPTTSSTKPPYITHSTTSSTTPSIPSSSITPSSTSTTHGYWAGSSSSTTADPDNTATTMEVTTIADSETPPTTAFDTTDTDETTSTESDEEYTSQETTMGETTMAETTMAETTMAETTEVSTTTPMPTTTEIPFILMRGTSECNTTACRRLAARMLDLMDLGDVDPCDDFYQYACGGVEDDHFLKPENPQHFSDAILTDYLQSMSSSDGTAGPVKTFYDGCMKYTTRLNETERLLKARDAFNTLGLDFIPTATPAAVDFDLTDTLAKMMKMHFTPFFDLTLDVDGEDPSSFILRLTPTLFTSPFTDDLTRSVCIAEYYKESSAAKAAGEDIDLDESYNVKYRQCKHKGAGMKARMQKMREAVKQMNVVDHVSDPATKAKMEDEALIDTNFLVEDLFEFLPSTPEFRRKMLNKGYNVTTLADLDIDLPGNIEWTRLVESVLGRTIDPMTTRVQVYFKDALYDIVDYINQEYDSRPSNLQNMFLALWSERVFNDIVQPLGSGLSTNDYCLRVTKNLMQDYASYVYMKGLEDRGELDHRVDQIKKIIRINKQAAREQLETHANPDDVMQLSEKLDDMMGEVADISVAKNALLVNMIGVTITGNFSLDAMTLLSRYRRLLYNNYPLTPHTPAVLWSQFLMPFSSYGTTIYPLNVFMIPYGALEPPLYYGDDVPMYVNYAGIGHMVAHELMHGFDATGNQYDTNMKSLMADAHFLVAPSECLAEQLDLQHSIKSRTNLTTTFTLHRGLALNEFIADSAAMRLALMAYDTYSGRGLDTHRRRRSLAANAHGRARRQAPMSTFSPPLFPIAPRPTLELEPIDFVEQPLPYLDHTPLQLFFLRMAQTHCSPTGDIMLTVKEDEHLTPYQRVNMVLRNEPYFQHAFQCPPDSGMVAPNTCSYSLASNLPN